MEVCRRTAGMLTWRYRGMEVRRIDASVAAWRHGVQEARYRRVRHGTLWRSAVVVATWRYGVPELAAAVRCGGMELGSSGGAM